MALLGHNLKKMNPQSSLQANMSNRSNHSAFNLQIKVSQHSAVLTPDGVNL